MTNIGNIGLAHWRRRCLADWLIDWLARSRWLVLERKLQMNVAWLVIIHSARNSFFFGQPSVSEADAKRSATHSMTAHLSILRAMKLHFLFSFIWVHASTEWCCPVSRRIVATKLTHSNYEKYRIDVKIVNEKTLPTERTTVAIRWKVITFPIIIFWNGYWWPGWLVIRFECEPEMNALPYIQSRHMANSRSQYTFSE